jgi:hypothetical protein
MKLSVEFPSVAYREGPEAVALDALCSQYSAATAAGLITDEKSGNQAASLQRHRLCLPRT